jgi:thermitase
VIDHGVAIKHPDLAANVWRNPGEIPGNEVDDDDNGYIDDVHGWNFVHGNNKVDAREPPFDSVIHGTHVAGIAAAAFENGTGIAGVCPRCTIMPLKTDFSLAQLLEALGYARAGWAPTSSTGATEASPGRGSSTTRFVPWEGTTS